MQNTNHEAARDRGAARSSRSGAGDQRTAALAQAPRVQAPTYAVASVDHALQLATILQIEGSLTVTQAAQRLAVARSTAHRLLRMLVYRDFAVQDEAKVYHAGPVLQLAGQSGSQMSALRSLALPHMARLVGLIGESVNLTVRTGLDVRFIASLESPRVLRVGSREGMTFPAHLTSGGLLLLAELSIEELTELYVGPRTDEAETADGTAHQVDLTRLSGELARVRKQGFAVNHERSERGIVAVGVPVRAPHPARGQAALACLSVSMPSVRYQRQRLPTLVGQLNRSARAIEADLERLGAA